MKKARFEFDGNTYNVIVDTYDRNNHKVDCSITDFFYTKRQAKQKRDIINYIFRKCREVMGVLAILLVFALPSFAKEARPPENLWKGLIAEDVSGGYEGMYAVACCVRNRLNKGINTGLCALKRKDLDAFVKRQGVKYEKIAKEIVKDVFKNDSNDVTFGATHYENIEKYGVPYWAKNMTKTVKIGEHTFYK